MIVHDAGHASVKMVTSNKLLDKKVVKMTEQNNSAVVPQRTLLGEVNEHITCPLCRGYYIDATTIVECLHSFCRSCIIKHLQVKSYCPVCEMMINSAKPNIKLDKALQDIVYKLVPGLFQKEMERRQQFYSSRPGPAATATPEQRGEDTERIIFSPEDVISFSLEYADATDTDSISSKSSDSNEPQPATATTRRFLQCPAVVNISHLKKFLSMKFDIDSTQFAIDILYKRVPLPDYYTLMDIAYIYNWKRNEPMRFFYQMIDYNAIRNRLFDINRKGSHFRDRKSSPAPTEDTNVSSPAPNLNDQGSEISSGTDSPMPDENKGKKSSNTSNTDKIGQSSKDSSQDKVPNIKAPSSKKNDEDVEKSQFLNSFELTAKNSSASVNTSPTKSSVKDSSTNNDISKSKGSPPKSEDILKRKKTMPSHAPEMKKLKIEIEKAKLPPNINKPVSAGSPSISSVVDSTKQITKDADSSIKPKEIEAKPSTQTLKNVLATPTVSSKDHKPPGNKQQVSESFGIKRPVPATTTISSPKRKPAVEPTTPTQHVGVSPKTVSPLKLQVPKLDSQLSVPKPTEVQKSNLKKIPDLKPTTPSQASQNKGPPINKVRMDLLANNSDPIDRSKNLSQVKSSLNAQSPGQNAGDPLKSLLLDSCKINIPSSLSITLTDQKLDPRSPNEPATSEPKKNFLNKNLVGANTTSAHKVPSPPVHNYIEILKLPDNNPKKQQNKTETSIDTKSAALGKNDSSATQTKPTKSSESSAKGPIPNLKPISDTKLGKQSGNFAAPITFQQTFEQQLQSFQTEKKVKGPKTKAQVPKLVPATPKSLSTANKVNNTTTKPAGSSTTVENKPSTALDLSTPHNIPSQLGSHQTRLFETMQSIVNLANKKQNLPAKVLPQTMTQANVFPNVSNRPMTAGPNPLRVPTSSSQVKHDKVSSIGSHSTNIRQDLQNKAYQISQTNLTNSIMSSPNYQPQSHTSTSTQPSPRSQTRSPSSSPKLVIAEDRQASSSSTDINVNQSNQISSTQVPNMNIPKNESHKVSPGLSKPGFKPVKPQTPTAKLSGIRQPITPTLKPSPVMNVPTNFMTQPELQNAIIRHQMENWYKAQKQYDFLKTMASHQNQHDFNNKDKQ